MNDENNVILEEFKSFFKYNVKGELGFTKPGEPISPDPITPLGEYAIQPYKTHYEFPNIGKENILYIGLEEKKIWCWNNGYVLLYDKVQAEDLEIDVIEGGNANG